MNGFSAYSFGYFYFPWRNAGAEENRVKA